MLKTLLSLPLWGRVIFGMGAAALISFCGIPFARRLAYKIGAMDVPEDDRRMHGQPIPRLGGVAIVFSFLTLTFLLVPMDSQMLRIVNGSVVILILGILDDIRRLKPLTKLLVQILAAIMAVSRENLINSLWLTPGVCLELGVLSWPVTVLWLVAVTNAVNFIDGLDGLAVGICSVSAGSMLAAALMLGQESHALVLAILLGACTGFLPWNFHPAKVFMGDTGATFLGFVLAGLSVKGLFQAETSAAVPVLILGIPVLDLCFAILRRACHGKNPMVADRGHIHHRLMDKGFSQRRSVLLLVVIQGTLGTAAVLLLRSSWAAALSTVLLAGSGLMPIFARNKTGTQGENVG